MPPETRAPLSLALARGHHLLVLPEGVARDDVLALAATRFDDAAILDATTARLTEGVTLSGPWSVAAGTRDDLGLPWWAHAAYQLRSPVRRAAPAPPELRGLGGLVDAFPEGEPIGIEGEAVAHLHAQARRLGGALRVAGSGAVLIPEPAVDLVLYSPLWLEPDAAARVVVPVLPGLGEADRTPSYQEIAAALMQAEGHRDRRAAVAAIDHERRRLLHATADAVDEVSRDAEPDAYGFSAELAGGGMVELRVGGEITPSALRAVPWARGGVVSYEVRWHRPAPGAEAAVRPQGPHGTVPGPVSAPDARGVATVLVEGITAALHDAVGGDVCDDDGFLVDPVSLQRIQPRPGGG